MPRKNLNDTSWTPPSLLHENFEIDDSDFIQDPDQHRDELPQPYRMIDKLLSRLLDSAWDFISHRESDRIADASRFRPPQYECAVHVEDDTGILANTECIAATPDGQYIIAGLQNGLAAIHAGTSQCVNVCVDNQAHIVDIQTCTLKEDLYVISTVDDMGCCRMYALMKEILHHLVNLNDTDSSSKVIVSKMELSQFGEFISLFIEKPSSQESWLEIHKLPKDSWIKDLDTLASKTATAADTSQTSQSIISPPTPTKDEPSVVELSEVADVSVDKTVSSTDDATRENKGLTSTSKSSHPSFTSSTVLLKVLPPAGITGATFSSVQQASKGLDNNCDVVGTGANHLITTGHLELRDAAFDHLHKDLIPYLPKTQEKAHRVPTVHFLRCGRIISQGFDSSRPDQPGCAAVWWSDDTMLTVYSLHKQSKEIERKADYVLPLSSVIVASSVSGDGSQLALGLHNNNLVLWDWYKGNAKGVCHVCDKGHVTSLSVLDPCVCPQNIASYPPYPVSTCYYVMVVVDNCRVFLINSDKMRDTPIALDLNIEKPDELMSRCLPLQGIPDLLLSSRQNGSIYLHNVHRGTQICEVVLPPGYEIMSPWQPPMAVGSRGGMLYLKGIPSETESNDITSDNTDVDVSSQQEEPPISKLFVFQLRSFPALDKYREREHPNVPFVVHTTASDRVDALFKQRLSGHGERLEKMRARWTELKKEVSIIEKLKTERQAQVEQKNSYASILVSEPSELKAKFW